MESAYEECLCYELLKSGISFERQKAIPYRDKEISLDCGYYLDVLVQNEIILELKSVESILPISTALTLTYLKLTGIQVGLLINFNFLVVSENIKRYVLECFSMHSVFSVVFFFNATRST